MSSESWKERKKKDFPRRPMLSNHCFHLSLIHTLTHRHGKMVPSVLPRSLSATRFPFFLSSFLFLFLFSLFPSPLMPPLSSSLSPPLTSSLSPSPPPVSPYTSSTHSLPLFLSFPQVLKSLLYFSLLGLILNDLP